VALIQFGRPSEALRINDELGEANPPRFVYKPWLTADRKFYSLALCRIANALIEAELLPKSRLVVPDEAQCNRARHFD
jgi:hypothetical protein